MISQKADHRHGNPRRSGGHRLPWVLGVRSSAAPRPSGGAAPLPPVPARLCAPVCSVPAALSGVAVAVVSFLNARVRVSVSVCVSDRSDF